jgi:hypothetical protein
MRLILFHVAFILNPELMKIQSQVSAHTILLLIGPGNWVKAKLKAIQVSKRRGYWDCELVGDRVLMSGEAVTY